MDGTLVADRDRDPADQAAALGAVHEMAFAPITALVRRATLEDVFLKLTGRSLVD